MTPDPSLVQAEQEPRWIEATLHAALHEVRDYLWTFGRVALRPKRFGVGWRRGEGRGLSPLTFLGMSAALQGGVLELTMRLFHMSQTDDSLSRQVLRAFAPYLYYGAVGLFCHGVLWCLRPTRRWTSSLAASLYSGAAMPTLSFLVSLIALALLARHGGAQVNGSGMSSNSPALIVLAMVPIIWFYVALARMLAGIHEIDGRLIAVVLTVAGLLTAFAPKAIDIPVWHAHVEIHHQADDWSIGWDLGNN